MLPYTCRKAKIKNGGNPKMKKVVYSIKKVRGNSDDKISDLGFLNEEGTLLISIIEQQNL